MTMALARSGTAFPEVDVPTWNYRVVHRSRTEFNSSVVRPEIAGVLRRWDNESPSSEVDSSEFPVDSVEAVAFVVAKLGVTQEEVLNAAGIKERTFFGWRNGVHRPRASSEGQLWPMVQVVGRLSNIHDHLAAWFQSSRSAREAFNAGDLNALIAAEMDWSLRNVPMRAPFIPGDDDVTIESNSEWSLIESEDVEETDIGSLLETANGDE